MKESTHKLEPCKNKDWKPIFVTASKEHGLLLRCDKSGSCKNATWHVIMELVQKMQEHGFEKEVIEIFRDVRCEEGYAGHKCCYSEVGKIMKSEEK